MPAQHAFQSFKESKITTKIGLYLQLDKMSIICLKEFLEVNCGLMFMIDTYNSFILNFTKISVLTDLIKFSALLMIME